MANDPPPDKLQDLRDRVERLEKFVGIADWQPTPGFDPVKLQRALLGYLIPLFGLFFVPLFVTLQLANVFQGQVSQEKLFGLPLWNIGGEPSLFGLPVGIVALGGGAIGLVSLGGLAVGGLAFGGGAVGIVAMGGGAVGLIAFGGGSFGFIAVGGGAYGYIAIGGGAFGVYVLAGDGRGKYVFDRRRQDEEAVRLFCKYLPRLRQVFVDEAPRTSVD